jgi:hypothetical protein
MLKQFRIADQEIAEAIIGKCLVLLRQRGANEERSVERVVAVRVERRKERQRGQQILLHVQFERTYHPSKDAEARQQEQEALVQLRQGGIVCVLCVRDQLRRVERGDGLVRLLNAPAQLPPQADEAQHADELKRLHEVVRLGGVGVAELQLFEAALAGCVGTGECEQAQDGLEVRFVLDPGHHIPAVLRFVEPGRKRIAELLWGNRLVNQLLPQIGQRRQRDAEPLQPRD